MNGKQQGVLQQSQRTPDADETIVISLDPESGISDQLIPTPSDQNPCAQSRSPMDMILQG